MIICTYVVKLPLTACVLSDIRRMQPELLLVKIRIQPNLSERRICEIISRFANSSEQLDPIRFVTWKQMRGHISERIADDDKPERYAMTRRTGTGQSFTNLFVFLIEDVAKCLRSSARISGFGLRTLPASPRR